MKNFAARNMVKLTLSPFAKLTFRLTQTFANHASFIVHRSSFRFTPILLVPLFFACNSPKKCQFKPEPIFSKDLPGVLQYNFEVQGAESLESVFFENQVMLELYQEVCDKTKQEYKFTVRGDYFKYPDSLWTREAVRQLTQLSTLSPKQAALRDWAGILEKNRAAMKLAEEKEVQPGVFAKIDRIVNPQQSILILTFNQK